MYDGKLRTEFGKSEFSITDEIGRSVIQQTDGKLVVAGYTGGYNNSDFALARYNLDGTLDTSFDGDGKLTTNFGRYSFGMSVIQQADGKLVAAGYAPTTNNLNNIFALARYHLDGTLDTSFDGDGKLTTNFGLGATVYSVIQQADGKLVAAGYSSGKFALARYNLDGTLDTSFDRDGKLTTDFGGLDVGQSIIQQADGKLVVAGYSTNNLETSFALVRYNLDGTLDASFDGDGKLTTNISKSNSRLSSVIQQADGKLVIAVDCYSDFMLVRYNLDGTLDTSFDRDGKLTTDFGGLDVGQSIIQQADGKLVVTGYTVANFSGDKDFALARYNLDGTLDTSFDGDGKQTTDFNFGSSDFGYSVIQQADGKIVVAGESDGDFSLARYNSDGSLDNTFGTLLTNNSLDNILNPFGITRQQAGAWVIQHLNKPQEIYSVASSVGITSNMLAELVKPFFPEIQAIGINNWLLANGQPSLI